MLSFPACAETPRATAKSAQEDPLIKHLRPTERVLWRGKPVKLPFLFSDSSGLALLLLVPSSLLLVWFSIVVLVALPLASRLLLVLMITLFALSAPISELMKYRNTEYMITNQRLITQTGTIGLHTRFVDLDKVQEVYVKVGLLDKVFRTGSLSVETAAFLPEDAAVQRYPLLSAFVRPSLEALKEPYEVQGILQEAIETTPNVAS